MNILQYPFDGAQILQKKRSIKKELLSNGSFIQKKIALVGGSTIGDIKNMLELFLLDAGIAPIFWEGGYGLFYENLVFDDGSLADFAPDVIYIHTSNRNLRAWPSPAISADDASANVLAEFTRFETAWNAAEKLACPIIQNNFELPLWRNFGNLDATNTQGRVHFVNTLNAKMAAYARNHKNFFVHDLAYLAATHGLDAWCSSEAWYAYKYTCAPEFIPALSHSVAAIIKSLFGRTKKSVISDLDNTLWGGIIGEVGAEGIELGDETPAGMAYAEFQAYLKMLASRGVLLNVASKNENNTAESGFARVDSPLKREDFLCFEANWGPKSESLVNIANSLNIGSDSFVFMDDNPAERELIMQELPEVTAPPVSQPEQSIKLIDRAAYFEVSILSTDDVKRGEMYRQNAQRQKQQTSFGDYTDYLKSLEMTANIQKFTPAHLERITQLINKSNQFNLTTQRYTTAEIECCMNDESYITLSSKLVDKFGDNGITTAIIASISGTNLEIDLWIMSCRVFKRHLEYAMFDALLAAAKSRNIKTISASYLPTAKNLLVKDFYATIGFELVDETDEKRDFIYTIPEKYTKKNTVITIGE